VFIGDDAKSFRSNATPAWQTCAHQIARCRDDTSCCELRDQLVYVAREDAVPLSKGTHYLYEIIGLRVVTTDGEVLGEITRF
jgi:ribosomal 30S subunit maturation factor RimM